MPPPAALISKEDTSSASPASLAPSGFEVWAEKEIKNQRKDIDRTSSTVDRIEKTMDDVKDFMEEVRGQRTADQEHQKVNVSSRQMQYTAIAKLGERMNVVEQRKRSNANAVERLTAISATKEDVSRLATLVESVGQREASDVSGLREEFRHMSARIGDTSEAGWEALRNELNTLKTKVMVLEASTKKMRSDAATTETSRVRNEANLHNRISQVLPCPRTEVIPMQRALELAGPAALYVTPYGRPYLAPHPAPSATPYGMNEQPYSVPPYAPQYANMSTPSYASPYEMQSSRPFDGRFMAQPGNGGPHQISMQHPREQVSIVNHVGNGPSYGVQLMPNGPPPINTIQPPRRVQNKRRIDVPMQQALELAGMVDQTSTSSSATPNASAPTQAMYEREIASVQSIQEGLKLIHAAAVPESSRNGVDNSVGPQSRQEGDAVNSNPHRVQEASLVGTVPRETIQMEIGGSLTQTTPRKERPAATLPIEFKKSIIRVEIGPLRMDQFPPIKNPEQINSAALSSPDPSDSDSSNSSSIPTVVKRKRTEPLSDSKGKGRAISPPRESQSKRRKVSTADAEATPRLESPEPEPSHEIIDIGSSDDEDRSSPDVFADDDAIQSIETQETDSQVPMLDQGDHDMLSMLNKVTKPPFRNSFGQNASSSTSIPVPKTQQRVAPMENRAAQMGRVEPLYDKASNPNFRPRPVSGASFEKFRSHLQDFTAPTPPTLKSRKALEQAAREDSPFDTPIQRGEDIMQSSNNTARQEALQGQPIATPEQIENPFKCGVCNRRFGKSAGLKIVCIDLACGGILYDKS